jgi:hypothetical protein
MGASKAKRIAVEGLLVPTTDTKTADVVIIGREDGAASSDLLRSLRTDSRMRVAAEFKTLPAALQAGLGQELQADFVIVLQSYSDEFAPAQINDLIGRLLFARIIVCYGPWCTADGRSHELWPIAFRVPVASAAALIELELSGFLSGDQALFPMSAGEEVFAHRRVFPKMTEITSRQAIVMSDDVEMRRTVPGILDALNCECIALPMLIPSIRSHLNSRIDKVRLAIIDLDGPCDNIDACLEVLHTEFGIKKIVGMSVFAASFASNETTRASRRESCAVSKHIEKTELLGQLQETCVW